MDRSRAHSRASSAGGDKNYEAVDARSSVDGRSTMDNSPNVNPSGLSPPIYPTQQRHFLSRAISIKALQQQHDLHMQRQQQMMDRNNNEDLLPLSRPRSHASRQGTPTNVPSSRRSSPGVPLNNQSVYPSRGPSPNYPPGYPPINRGPSRGPSRAPSRAPSPPLLPSIQEVSKATAPQPLPIITPKPSRPSTPHLINAISPPSLHVDEPPKIPPQLSMSSPFERPSPEETKNIISETIQIANEMGVGAVDNEILAINNNNNNNNSNKFDNSNAIDDKLLEEVTQKLNHELEEISGADEDILSPSKESILLDQPTQGLSGTRAVWTRDVATDRDEWMKFANEHKRINRDRRASVTPTYVKKYVSIICCVVFIYYFATILLSRSIYRKSRVTLTRWDFLILYMLAFVTAILVLLYYLVDRVGYEPLQWMTYFDVAIGGFLILRKLFRFIISSLKAIHLYEQYVYYFVKDFHDSFAIIGVCGGLVFPLYATNLFPDAFHDDNQMFVRTHVSLLVLASTNFVKGVFSKLAFGYANKKHFLSQIVQALFYEKMLVNLLLPPRLERENNKANPASKIKTKQLLGSLNLKRFAGMEERVRRTEIHLLSRDMEGWEGVNSTSKAKELAKRVFQNVDRDQKGYIIPEDIGHFINPKYVDRVFASFDTNMSGQIEINEVEDMVLRVYKERKALANGLKDSANIGNVLMRIVDTVLWIVMFFVVLAIYKVDFVNFLYPLATFLVGLSFAFGNAAQDVINSIVLLFTIHPFDVGDRITIDGGDIFVDKINLMYTEFFQPDGKAVIIKNSLLAEKHITNLTRSKLVSQRFDIQIDFYTSLNKIADFKLIIKSYLLENPKDWQSDLYFWINDMAETNRINIMFFCISQHRWIASLDHLNTKTELWFVVRKALQELGIIYYKTPQPVFMVQDESNLVCSDWYKKKIA